jgi:hypothetical protein
MHCLLYNMSSQNCRNRILSHPSQQSLQPKVLNVIVLAWFCPQPLILQKNQNHTAYTNAHWHHVKFNRRQWCEILDEGLALLYGMQLHKMLWVWAQNICHHLPLHPPKKSQLTSTLPLSTTHDIHQWIPDTNQYTTVKAKKTWTSIIIHWSLQNTKHTKQTKCKCRQTKDGTVDIHHLL